MPYEVEKQGDDYVVKKPGKGGKVFGRHKSKKKARAQQAAIYASTDENVDRAKMIEEVASMVTNDPDVFHENANKTYGEYRKTAVPLTAEERAEVMKRKAVWHHGPNGEETPAVWKSRNADGSFTFITNTHRAMDTAKTLKGAINRYHRFIKGTA